MQSIIKREAGLKDLGKSVRPHEEWNGMSWREHQGSPFDKEISVRGTAWDYGCCSSHHRHRGKTWGQDEVTEGPQVGQGPEHSLLQQLPVSVLSSCCSTPQTPQVQPPFQSTQLETSAASEQRLLCPGSDYSEPHLDFKGQPWRSRAQAENCHQGQITQCAAHVG